MIGTIRWNVTLGSLGFGLTFLSSLASNLFITTMVRSIYGFLILFIVAFLIRWLLGTVVGLKEIGKPLQPKEDTSKGKNVDMLTPTEDQSLQELLKQNMEKPMENVAEDIPFSPLKPPKLVSKIREENPEDLATAVRRLTEE
jgi:hypothetical protein